MTILALVSFGALMLSWLVAPDGRGSTPTADVTPEAQPAAA